MNLNKENLIENKRMVKITKEGTHTAYIHRNKNTITYSFKSIDGKEGNQITGTIIDIISKVDSRGWEVPEETAKKELADKYYTTDVIAKRLEITPAQLRKLLRKEGYDKSPGTNKYFLTSKQIEELRTKLK